jgi:hypothetical protein
MDHHDGLSPQPSVLYRSGPAGEYEMMKIVSRASAAALLSIFLVALGTNLIGLAQTETWSEPVNISNTPSDSWFPDLVVDNRSNVHVVWCETVRPEGIGQLLDEKVYYTVWDGYGWSEPNDLVPGNPDINRNALAIDGFDNLYLTFRYGVTGGIGTVFMRAPADQAWSAAAWTAPHRVDVRANAYMSDLAVDSQGVMHLVFDDRGADPEPEVCLGGCSDLYYRQSVDKGQTWSYPVNLSRSPVGASREQIEIDSSDTIHITWDEGWDRINGGIDPISGSYTFSTDGGQTWSPVTSVTYPESTLAQLTVGSDGQGGVMLVWRATSTEEIYYQWSADGGHSWGAPSVIPRIFARPWAQPYDMYDMAADSSGNIQLIVVGREYPGKDALLGVYHLVWDGIGWSIPTRIFAVAGWLPEYPKIVVHEGNHLHATWFVREGGLWDEDVQKEVWYSSSQSAAPHQPVTPVPTLTPEPPKPSPSPTPTATPYPTVSFEDHGLPDGLHTESDDVFRLVISLSPVVLVILLVIVVKMGWFGKY